ncbi:hypothetical protein Gotur_007853, partial [Gossypium turneri]
MENDIVGLTIQNEEENAWQISSNGDDPVSNFGLCLVGCFLTASVALPRRALAPISAWLRDEGYRVEETQSDAPGPKVGVPATSYTSNIVNVISKNLGLHLDGVAPNLKEKDIEDVGDPQDAMDEMGLM